MLLDVRGLWQRAKTWTMHGFNHSKEVTFSYRKATNIAFGGKTVSLIWTQHVTEQIWIETGITNGQVSHHEGKRYISKNQSSQINPFTALENVTQPLNPFLGVGRGSSDFPCSDIYHGKTPFSAPEVKAVSDYVEANKGNIFSSIDIHSYSQLWMYPWSYTKDEKIKDTGELVRKNHFLTTEWMPLFFYFIVRIVFSSLRSHSNTITIWLYYELHYNISSLYIIIYHLISIESCITLVCTSVKKRTQHRFWCWTSCNHHL